MNIKFVTIRRHGKKSLRRSTIYPVQKEKNKDRGKWIKEENIMGL